MGEMVFRRQMVAKWAGMLNEIHVVWEVVIAAANAESNSWR